MHCIFLAGTALGFWLTPIVALAQDANGRPASFDERYRLEQTSPQTAAPAVPAPAAVPAQLESVSTTQTVTTGQNAARPRRVVRSERPRARVVVLPRSYLDAGTEVLPGERKFLDYAYPPTYQP